MLAYEQREGTEDVRGPGVAPGERGGELVQRRVGNGLGVGGHAPPTADGDDSAVLGRLGGDERGRAEGQLEHEAARVVGYPAE